MGSRRAWLWAGGGVAVVLVLLGIWWFGGSEAPEATIEDAAEAARGTGTQATGTAAPPTPAESAEPTEEPSPRIEPPTPTEADSSADSTDTPSLAGTWTVQPGNQEAIEDSTFVGYRVDEEISSIGANTAVGRTPDVEGSLDLDGTTVTSGFFEADLTTLESDQAMRDNALSTRGLETQEFPTATFAITEPVELPGEAADGEQIEATATGDFTLHGTTNTVDVPVEAQLVDDTIAIVGTFDIDMTEYGIDPPTGFRVLTIDEQATVEFQLFLTR